MDTYSEVTTPGPIVGGTGISSPGVWGGTTLAFDPAQKMIVESQMSEQLSHSLVAGMTRLVCGEPEDVESRLGTGVPAA